MGQRTHFRVGDDVTVHNYVAGETTKGPFPGRVVCINRKSRYGMSIIVLIDVGDSELVESFKPDGTRYLAHSTTRITLGYKP